MVNCVGVVGLADRLRRRPTGARRAGGRRDGSHDQKHEQALDMRDLLEAIVSHGNGVETAALMEIQRYTKLFWINNGPYNNLTARKFVLQVSPQAFAAAAKSAAQAGATFPTQGGESLDALLTRLQPMFFDAT